VPSLAGAFSRCLVVERDLKDQTGELSLTVFTPEGWRVSRIVSSTGGPTVPESVLQRLCDGLKGALSSFEREHARFLDYLFSCDPVDGEASARARRLIQGLSDDDYDVRERAARDLVALGQPALRAIRGLNSRCPETLARCGDVRRALEGLDAVTRGWERNVPCLLRLVDPRARRRLDRIIGSAAERWRELRCDEALDKYVEGD
jgi:hypothetical protein